MRSEYANNDHFKWIEETTKKTCSPLGQQVANVLGYVAGGIYNAPINPKTIEWGNPHHVSVIWRGHLCNWDGPSLSLLWVECSRRLLRVEVEGVAPGLLRLTFYQRDSIQGASSERLPTCEELIGIVDRHFGRPAPVLGSCPVLCGDQP